MAWLADRRLAVSTADLEAFVAGQKPLAAGSVTVTIDDGCPSVYFAALPVLRRHRIPAVVFLPAGELVAEAAPAAPITDASPGARITWKQLDALLEAGLTVGSHSLTHRSLGRMSATEAREQIERSREMLERHTGQSVTTFAYPFGTRADYSPVTAKLLRDAGYRLAFTSQHGAIEAGADPFELPRVKVEGGEGWWMFRGLLAGGMDSWRWVDRTLWRLQAAGD
jgi:peptidoglycan/xylan/chitin deacetylase (PgdA/CDA1 family)